MIALALFVLGSCLLLLKATALITWSWFWAAAPFLLLGALGLVFVILSLLVGFLEGREQRRYQIQKGEAWKTR